MHHAVFSAWGAPESIAIFMAWIAPSVSPINSRT